MFELGEKDPKALLREMRSLLAEEKGVRVQYWKSWTRIASHP
jgi:hypothetical protein